MEVTATQTATGIRRTALSNERGAYILPNLPVGPYQLKVVLQGFNTYVRDGIVLRTDETPRIDVQLEVGSVSESINVTAATPLLETETFVLRTNHRRRHDRQNSGSGEESGAPYPVYAGD